MSAVLTVLFVVTGGWATVRLVQVAVRRGPAPDVLAELTHLVMSAAMIAMTWGVVTGPTDAGGVATLVVFGLVAAFAVVRLTRHRSVVTGHHLLMAAAMIWMVAAMPEIMGITDSGPPTPGALGPEAMPGMPDMTATVRDAVPSAWVTTLTWLLVLLLVAAAALWALRVLRPASGESPFGVWESDAAEQTPAGGGVAVLASPIAVPARVATPGIGRLDACCHALMSLGMAAMVVTMF